MSPTRILSLVAAALLAFAPAVVTAEPPAVKPCCCCDDVKPCATTCPAQTPTTAASPCCCEADGCCAAGKCCDAKAGCECKDCCCAKGCSCSKSKGVAKAAPGCCPTTGFATEAIPSSPCLPPRPFRTAVVAPLPPPPPLPPVAFPRPSMPLPEPLPLGYAVPPPPAFVPGRSLEADCLEMQAMTFPKWSVKAATSRGATSLEISQDEACKLTCEKFRLTVGEDSFDVTVRDNQVAITGDILKGVADRITRTPNTDQIVLEGNVKATYNKSGQKADLSGGTVVVDLAEGSVQVKPAQSEEVQLFQFFMGFWN